ncbi:leukocidin family pore-forming toxin [Aeromonas cavernicola]|uniref:Hemolysin n=1 Tax=Aeromonas cavernicola TaxID=1006623 RepID=A0A2H9U3N8_9GAMM|nr:leukocidin family pore-forming toxin [Aeromonas cavernicola]PJG58653.1 hemolysin [Aeromonas cavernicola]
MKHTNTRKNITQVPHLSLLALALLAGSGHAEDIGERSAQGIAMLASLPSELGVTYLNAKVWVAGEEAHLLPISRDQLRERVLTKGETLLIDFSELTDSSRRQQAKKAMEQLAGVSFDANVVLVSAYKGEMLFTPLSGMDDPAFYQTMARAESLVAYQDSQARPTAGETGLPHVAFYLNVNRPISAAECTFPRSRTWDRGSRVFCDSANISLVYRVTLERSLQFGNTGAATPDAKIVRISLDEESAGAGIQLNETLGWVENSADYLVLDGWAKDYATDAIAQDYRLTIAASNTKATLLRSTPGNLNSNYEHREISGFQIGVTGGAEVSKEGPKAKLEASATFSQQRQLAYNTQDYRIEHSAPNAQRVSFSWVREQYATAESLLASKTATVWGMGYNVDHTRIKPLSYQGFVPNLDVIYKAAPDEQGSTAFNIDSSVNIRPLYTGIYKHYYVFGGHISFQGFDDADKRRRVTASETFTVNWNHPVFTGGRPVNVQLGSFDNRCLSADSQHTLSAVTCDETSVAQSFIYDQNGRYVSAQDTRFCLDGNNLEQLQRCSQSLGQRWEWQQNSDQLRNLRNHQQLGHDKQTGALALYDENGEPSHVSVRTLTSYTRIFSAPDRAQQTY